MTDWRYLPLKWFLFGTAHLPFRVLYIISDILFFMIFYIARYRRNVVMKNIMESFPELPESKHRDICRKFYRHFTDYIVETIKLHHISDAEIKDRMEYRNLELVDRLFDQGKSIVMYFSHCGNWEWATSITLFTRHTINDVVFAQVYRPLKNAWFDAYFLHLRGRFGSISFPKRTVIRNLLKLHNEGTLSITGFMSDQKPSHNDSVHIVKFLNHPTAMIAGTELLARKLDMAAVYWDIEKVKRGHYRLTARLITDTPKELPEMAMTATYASMLEATIRRNPSIWLWTHKRWKYPVKMPSDNE